MKIKVFEPNRYGKIEFTRAELEKLLNEVYTDGYKEGEYDARSRSWTWISPSNTSTGANFITNNAAIDENKTVSDNSNVLATKVDTASTVNDTATYTIEASGSISDVDLNKLVNDIFISDSKKIEDAFDKLAKELNF